VKAQRTRQYILERAAPLFNTKGFDGTSLSDLERATGLTKGALYGNFGDKETLASESFAFSATQVRSRINERLNGISTYKGKLFAVLDFFSEYVLNPPVAGGCPLLNAAVEVDDHRVSMRGRVAQEIVEIVNSIAVLLKKGIKSGEFRKDTDVRALAYVIFCSVEGAIMFSRVERSREPMNIVVKHLKNKIDQITCNQKG
jgi:TetR/AcrR family transcriptional repressor of nem operon